MRELAKSLFAMVVIFCLELFIISLVHAAPAPDPDLNNDGVVNILDVSLVGSCFGQNPAVRIPKVAITNPEDGAVLNETSITVSGNVDIVSSKVEVNGIAAAMNTDGSFTASGITLQPGNNTIAVSAKGPLNSCEIADTDADGDVDYKDLTYVYSSFGKKGFPLEGPTPTQGVGTASIQVTLQPPQISLTIMQPAAGALLNATPITVSGSVSDPAALVKVNGVEATVAPDGSYSATEMALSEGPNTITATATGTLGNESSISISVTLDTTPPQITITTPANQAVLFEPQVRVVGTIDDNEAELTVNDQGVSIVDGKWNCEVPLALGENTITAVAADAAGNSSQLSLVVTREEPKLVSISVSPAVMRFSSVASERALTVEGLFSDGKTEIITASTSGTTYESSNSTVARVSSEGVVASAADGTATITVHNGELQATATVSVEIGVTLQKLLLTPEEITLREKNSSQQLQLSGLFSNGATRDLTTASSGTVYSSSDPEIATVSKDGLVTANSSGTLTVTAANEDLTASARVTVFIGAAKGFIKGEVYHDKKGLTLADASVTLLKDGGGSLEEPRTASTDGRGKFILSGLEGDALIQIQKTGFTSVERHAVIPFQTSATILDARLTPLNSAKVKVAASAGGELQDTTANYSVSIEPGALEMDTDLRLTAISNQGLQAKLPMGWSPIATADIWPVGITFSLPALLRVPNDLNLPAESEVSVAYYDLQNHQWIATEPAQVAADKSSIAVVIPHSGQFTILLPDEQPFTPPIPLVGQAIEGIDAVLVPENLSASGEVTPPVAPPGENAKAVGTVSLGKSASLPSGTVVEAHVSEQYNLLDTTKVIPFPFIQDLILYASPAVGNDAGIGTTFPIFPSRSFTIQELELGVVKVQIRPQGSELGGDVVGPSGGKVSEPGGASVQIPANALDADTVVRLTAFSAEVLPLNLPQAFEILGALELDLSGAMLAHSAVLSLPQPTGLSNTGQIIVARVLNEFDGVPWLEVAALGKMENSMLTSQIEIGAVTLGGISESGQYLFIQVPEALGFITGVIYDADSVTPQSRVLVIANTAPFADASDSAGQYLIAGRVNEETSVVAMDLAKGNLGNGKATVPALNGAASLDVILEVVAPSVLSSSPEANATNVPLSSSITVEFSEPIAESTVNSNSVILAGGGSTVEVKRVLSADGRTLTVVPTAGLQSKTSYELLLTQDLKDLTGNPLTVQVSIVFKTVDTSKPKEPEAGQITAQLPDESGLVMIFGTQGTAEAGSSITATNLRTQETLTVKVQTDGSFRIHLTAKIGDQIGLTFRNASGQSVTMSIDQFENADGTVALGVQGGQFSGSDGKIAKILARSLTAAGIFKLNTFTGQASMPTLPSEFSLVDGFDLAMSDAVFNALQSLTLTESQQRFEAQTAVRQPFAATGSLVVPADFLINGSIRCSATVQASDGSRSSVNKSTLVVAADPDTTSAEASYTERFPTLFLTSPKQAIPYQQMQASAIAPSARVEFELPAAADLSSQTPLFLARLVSFNGESRLSVVDQLNVVEIDGSPFMQTSGRELPGVSKAGRYVVIASATPLVSVKGKVSGPAVTVSVSGTPFIFETDGPNGNFNVSVVAGQPFTLSFSNSETGAEIGTTSGQAPTSGTLDLGDPLNTVAGELKVSALPASNSIVDIIADINFSFSEAVDAGTISSNTIIVTDSAGSRVSGRFSLSEDETRVTFKPLRRWRYGATYRYGVTTGVLGLSGAKLSGIFSGQFTTFTPHLLRNFAVDTAKDVAVLDNLALVAGNNGLSVLDVTDPSEPLLVSQLGQQGGASAVYLLNDAALGGVIGLTAVGSEQTTGWLKIVNLGIPETPEVIGAAQLTVPTGQTAPASVPNAPGVPSAVILGSNHNAMVAVKGVGIESVDLNLAIPEDPAAPGKALGTKYPADGLGSFNHVALLDEKILAVGSSGLTILDALTLESLGSVSTAGDAQGVAGIAGLKIDKNGDGAVDAKTETFDLAVVANGTDGTLQFYDITDPSAPSLLGVVRMGNETKGILLTPEEGLAYVACGSKGVKIVDLIGATSVQPIDLDYNGVDDRILGQVVTGGTSARLALDPAQGIAYVADGTAGVSVVQLIPARSTITEVVRDPVAAATGDENSIFESREAYITDDAIKVTFSSVVPPQSEILLTIEETPEAGGSAILSFADGSQSTSVAPGVTTVTLNLDKSSASMGSLVTLRVQNQSGSLLDTLDFRLLKPDLTGLTLQSLFIAPKEVTIPDGTATAQISVGGLFSDNRVFNLTASSSGTVYAVDNSFVAGIDAEGLITAVAGGTAQVAATNQGRSAGVFVTVQSPPKLTEIEVTSPYVTLKDPGAQQKLRINGLLSSGDLQDITLGAGTEYSSSDPNVVTVDSEGNITAKGNGTAIITITNGDFQVSVRVAVEFRTSPTVTGIELTPFGAPATTDNGEVQVAAKLLGTGSLEELQVKFTLSGAASIERTISTDYSGIAMDVIGGLNSPGSVTVTASVADPSSGTIFTDSKSLVVEAAGSDSEPNNDISSATRLVRETSVEGLLDAAEDSRDVFRVPLTIDGKLRASFSLSQTAQLQHIAITVLSADGTELVGITPTSYDVSLSVDVPQGDSFIAIETSEGKLFYQMQTVFDQASISIDSVTPSSGGAGTLVIIKGSGFSSDPQENMVLFGSIAGKLVSASATELQVLVPANAVNSPIEVVVGSKSSLGPGYITYIEGPAPSVSLMPSNPDSIRFDPVFKEFVEVNRLLVQFDPISTGPEVESIAANFGGQVVGFLPNFNTYYLEFPSIANLANLAELQKRIEEHDRVVFASRNAFIKADSSAIQTYSSLGRHEIDSDRPSDPSPIPLPYNHQKLTEPNKGKQRTFYLGKAYENTGIFAAIRYLRSLPDLEETAEMKTHLKTTNVAVIDSGFAPYLQSEFSSSEIAVTSLKCSDDCAATNHTCCEFQDDSGWYDPNGHGTHVTSIIAGSNNGRHQELGPSYQSGLVASLFRSDEKDAADEKIKVRVFNVSSDTPDLARKGVLSTCKIIGVLDSIKNNTGYSKAQIVNMSLGFSFLQRGDRSCDSPKEEQSEYQRKACMFIQRMKALESVLFVVAAGNEGIDAKYTLPAALSLDLDNVLTVGALAVDNIDETGESEDERAVFGKISTDETSININIFNNSIYKSLFCDEYGNRASNCGTPVNLAAPGEDVNGAGWTEPRGYVMDNGTSFAAPFVAGAAAILQCLRSEETQPIVPKQLKRILIQSGRDITSKWNGKRRGTGNGALLPTGELKESLRAREMRCLDILSAVRHTLFP